MAAKGAENLEQAYGYVAEADPQAANDFVARSAIVLVQKLQAAVEQLAEFSMMGRLGRVAATRELVMAGTPYIVSCRVKEKTVEVLRVLHSSRKYLE